MRRLILLFATLALMVGWTASYRTLGALDRALAPTSAQGLRALSLYLRGDYAAAARAYREAWRGRYADYGDDTSGREALTRGDVAAAERRARMTLALVPTALDPVLTLAEVALDRNDPAAALPQLETVLDRHPDHVDALLLAAVAAGRLGDADRALGAMNRALRQGGVGTRPTLLFRVMEAAGDLARQPRPPLCLLAHYHRYLRIFDDGQGEVARAWAERAVAAGDHPADAWLTIGIVHDKRGDHDRALGAFQQAIAVDSRHAEAYRWAAVQAHRLRDLLLEYRMARAAVEAAPGDPFYLAPAEQVVMRRFGDAQTMSALQARVRDETSPSALTRTGAARGDRDEAAAPARQAADLPRRHAW